MRKVDDGEENKKERKKRKRKEWRFLWPLRHCQQSTARTMTAGMPHARAKMLGPNSFGVLPILQV